MSTRLAAKRIQIWEGELPIFVARVESPGGTPITASQVSSVGVKVFDLSSTTPTEYVYIDSPIDPLTVYTTALVYDDYSNLLGDDGGRNFLYVLNGYSLSGGKTYREQIASDVTGAGHMQVYDVVVGEIL